MATPSVAAISPTVTAPPLPPAPPANPLTPHAAAAGDGTAWTGGRLPSPWAAGANGVTGVDAGTRPGGGVSRNRPAPSAALQFSQAVEQARDGMATAAPGVHAVGGVVKPGEAGLGRHFGFTSMEQMGQRLSKADADMSRSIESLAHLDPSAPDVTAQILSVSLMSAKAGVSETIALKFASKVNESINTLMKTQ